MFGGAPARNGIVSVTTIRSKPAVARFSYESPPASMPVNGFVVDRSMVGTCEPDAVTPAIPACTAIVSMWWAGAG